MNRERRGFTLLELLVVVAIIGLLSSVVLASLGIARTNAKYASAKEALMHITKAIQVAEGESGKTLMQITGSNCSDCNVCRTGGDMRNTGSACYVQWASVMNKVETAAAGLQQGAGNMTRDPWGSPYMLDENEGEQVATPCVHDSLRTVGPDGLWGTADDYVLALPFSGNKGC